MKGNEGDFKLSDVPGESITVRTGATGYIHLTVEKDGGIETMTSSRFNFYTDPGRTTMIALFEEYTGVNVPAVGITHLRTPISAGRHEIKSIFDDVDAIVGVYGTGNYNGVGGPGFGKGILKLDEVSSDPARNYWKGSFEFIQKSTLGEIQKVVVKEFWAELNRPD